MTGTLASAGYGGALFVAIVGALAIQAHCPALPANGPGSVNLLTNHWPASPPTANPQPSESIDKWKATNDVRLSVSRVLYKVSKSSARDGQLTAAKR